MEQFDIYSDIAARTGGTLFFGVVGPVRTGKSTFIAKMMETLVLPNVPEGPKKQRMTDEMPQSGSGKTVMTTQPKFVPSESAHIVLNDQVEMDVRFVDCVGYMVPGALGTAEGDVPRMVKTPWFDEEIPFEKAAEIGTEKVIRDHSTIGILMTTDGSFTGIERAQYAAAEKRAVAELKQTDKPFIVLLNTTEPESAASKELAAQMREEYAAAVLAVDVKALSMKDVEQILQTVLYEFPLTQVDFDVPAWVGVLDDGHWFVEELMQSVQNASENVRRIKDCFSETLFENTQTTAPHMLRADLSNGTVLFDMGVAPNIFYQILSERCGSEIADERQLLSMMEELMVAKREYGRFSEALQAVKTTGYGLVAPTQEELTLDEPEMVKQGNRFGVRLKASGPSYHLLRVDIESVITPIVGAEQESAQLINYMLDKFENDPAKIWETEMFGRSLNDLLKEGLSTKLMRMPEDVREKIQQTLSRIINEGNAGLLCILI